MHQEEVALVMLRGVIAGAPPDEQTKVHEAAEKIRAIVAEHGDLGKVAVALVCAELTFEK